MIPSVLSTQVRRGLQDFLLTTFPITNPFFSGTIERLFEQDEVFRGAYVSLKLPFAPALGGPKQFHRIVPPNFSPYRHQQRAWQRLDSRAGLSTIVATGTGSGKTECFLYPILDYCLQQQGRPGIKAILIYPMNALATDQARRLAKLVFDNSELRGHLTAGLYLGQDGPDAASSAVMTATELISNRDAMRAAPPDILLTNYKMLDYLLMRAQDAGLWKHNAADTLRYLVVDELHSFDGAQGADLACLIRRVKERVKTPKGHLICVGTSATLGDSRPEVTSDLADYAKRVFGESFAEDSLIGESVLTADEFLAGQVVRFFQPPEHSAKQELDPLSYSDIPQFVAAQYRLWFGGTIADWDDSAWRHELGQRLRSHSFLRNLLYILDGKSKDSLKLLEEIGKQVPAFAHSDGDYLALLFTSFMALVSQARVPTPQGSQPLVNVRYQLWLRELRRMVSRVAKPPELAFADDLKPEELKRSLPVVHCRECGITGWGGVVKDAENTLQADLTGFYESFFAHSQHVRFVFPGMSGEGIPEYLCPNCLNIYPASAAVDCAGCGTGAGEQLIVWVFHSWARQPAGGKIEGNHDCKACGGVNSLSILGSRAASLTSVLIAQIFGSSFNRDKRMLAFSDNVQDASHRAGFFGARTYSFNLRGAIQKILPADPVPLEELTRRFLHHWETSMGEARFVAAFLPPDMEWLNDFEYLRQHGKLPPESNLIQLVRRRLDWEIWTEYTLDARIGRTPEKTNCSTLELKHEVMEGVTESLLERLRNEFGGLESLDGPTLATFLEGIFQQMKNKGGVDQADLYRYQESKGDYFLLGNRLGQVHRPAVGRSSRVPIFLVNEPGSRFAYAGSKSWYEHWLGKCLGLVDGNVTKFTWEIYRHVFRELVSSGAFFEKPAKFSLVWGFQQSALQVTRRVVQLRCDQRGHALSVSPAGATRLAGSPCPDAACPGRMRVVPETQDYYRRMYESGDTQRVFTAEHTGLLTRSAREEIERGFMEHNRPADPNLLSCTPTLEMGINIGDLSSLAMCSIPPKPSNYLQRAGRAGRVDGNAFILAVANGRPHDLFFFSEPDEMIQGVVETPGCYLNASAVLERQFTAYCFDRWVETGRSLIPQRMQAVIEAVEKPEAEGPELFPWNFLKFFDLRRTQLEQGFLAMFEGDIQDYTIRKIEEFSRDGSESDKGMRRGLLESLQRVATEFRALRRRIRALNDRVREMEKNPARPKEFEEELLSLRDERDALIRLAREISDQNVVEFLTDEGLLPNYAFPEAGVTLKSVIIRRRSKPGPNGERSDIHYEKYPRPASAALSELAPANFFHAEKRRLEIDQVNLDLSKVEDWRFCNDCSFMLEEVLNQGRQECPQCKSAMWADEGQSRQMLRMRQVISTMTDQESRSFDESDDREPQFYQKNMFVVRDENEITQAYFIDSEEVPFGYEFFRKLTIREVNFGERGGGDGQMRIAGRDWADRPFRFCAGCGKIRKGAKGKLDHARYCPFYGKEEKAVEESASFLYRELTSEAIRMLLPVATAEVEKNLNSFVAALDLGLRKKFRGEPGHLLSTTYDEPIEGSDVRKRFLVLYDGVPGGTGYLKELMQLPDTLFEVFQLAHEVLAACRCQHDPNKDGCYRCLLAYHGRHDRLNTSRAAALKLLTTILEHRADLKQTDRLNNIRMNRLIESELEARFIEALRRSRPGVWQLTTQVVNGKQGFYLKTDNQNYLIEPQVALGPEQNISRMSIADFVFYPERQAVGELPIVVFTDGFEYHADPANLRVGMDMAQRMAIARSGKFHVWSLTWEDVDAVAKGTQEPAFAEGASALPLLKKLDPGGAAEWDKMYARTAFDWFLFRLAGGKAMNWQLHARVWLATRLNARNWEEEAARNKEDSLLRPGDSFVVPDKAANGEPTPFRCVAARDSAIGYVVRGDTTELPNGLNGLAASFRLFDEAASEDRLKWKQDWRRFLQWFNLLQFAGPVNFVTSSGLSDGLYGAMLVPELVGQERTIFVDLVDASLRELITQLEAARKMLPQAGYELAAEDGEIVATAELAWEEPLIALLLEHEWEQRAEFETRGWKVYRAAEVITSQTALIEELPVAACQQ